MLNLKKYSDFLSVLCCVISFLFCGCSVPLYQEEQSINSLNTQPRFCITVSSNDQQETSISMKDINLSDLYGNITLSEAGDYCLSGDFYGTIFIDSEDDNVHLYLNNANINSVSGPAIHILSASKVFITSMEGTNNYLVDSPEYSKIENEDACIYAPCDLTINGSGTLSITGIYGTAIHSTDTVKIINSSVKILSKKDSLRGNDGILIKNSTANIESENNGIKTTKHNTKNKGNVELIDSKVTIVAGKYAILSENDIIYQNGSYYLKGVLGNTKCFGTEYTTGESH